MVLFANIFKGVIEQGLIHVIASEELFIVLLGGMRRGMVGSSVGKKEKRKTAPLIMANTLVQPLDLPAKSMLLALVLTAEGVKRVNAVVFLAEVGK